MNTGSFDDDWEVKFPEKQIQIRILSKWEKVKKFRHRYLLSDFHKYAHRMQASEAGIAYETIFESDAMKPVEGIPKKLELINGWEIPASSIEKMVGNGYVLLGYGKLLVPEHSSRFWESINLKPGLFGVGVDLKKLFKK